MTGADREHGPELPDLERIWAALEAAEGIDLSRVVLAGRGEVAVLAGSVASPRRPTGRSPSSRASACPS